MKPCSNCPFRLDRPGFIRAARGREIANALENDGAFECHKTLDYNTDDEEPRRTPKSRWCAGALLFLEHTGGAERNQMVRIAQRFGMLDLDRLDRTAAVPRTLRAWLAHLRKGESR